MNALRSVQSIARMWHERRAGRALVGLAVDWAGTGVNIALTFILTPMVLRLLSPPMYGFWIAASQVMVLLNLVDAGGSLYLSKTIAAKRPHNGPGSLDALIGTTAWIYVGLGLLTLTIGAALVPNIAVWLKVPAGHQGEATVAFGLLLVSAVLALVFAPTCYGILFGHQRIALVNGINSAVTGVGLLVGLALLRAEGSVTALATGQLLATVLGGLVALVWVRQVAPDVSFWPIRFDREVLRESVGFSGYVQMAKLAFIASTFSDGILLATALGPASVTSYTITQKLAATAFMFVAKASGAVMPGLAELFAHGNFAALQSATLRVLRLVVRVSVLGALMVMALNERFVTLWVGPSVFGGLALTGLFAYWMLRNSIIRNLSAVLYASGELSGWAWLSLAEGVAKIALTLLLLPRLGLLAPVLATVVAEVLTAIYTPIRVARLIRLPLVALIGDAVVRPGLRSVPTAVVAAFATWLVPVTWGWIGLAVVATAVLLTNTLTFDWLQLRRQWARLLALSDPLAS
jgi:O-antigen/teichoic acid export membrane protein